MKLRDIMHPTLTRYGCDCHSKKQAFEFISHIASAAEVGLNHHAVLENLLERERIGCTAIGNGVAIPHAKIKKLQQPLCIILSLKQAIKFNQDENSSAVDLLFTLLIPNKDSEQYTQLLAKLTEQFKKAEYLRQIRAASNNAELFKAASNTK